MKSRLAEHISEKGRETNIHVSSICMSCESAETNIEPSHSLNARYLLELAFISSVIEDSPIYHSNIGTRLL
jgi:hypothetical protein